MSNEEDIETTRREIREDIEAVRKLAAHLEIAYIQYELSKDDEKKLEYIDQCILADIKTLIEYLNNKHLLKQNN